MKNLCWREREYFTERKASEESKQQKECQRGKMLRVGKGKRGKGEVIVMKDDDKMKNVCVVDEKRRKCVDEKKSRIKDCFAYLIK
jgi:predicted RNA-binding protein with PUA domain